MSIPKYSNQKVPSEKENVEALQARLTSEYADQGLFTGVFEEAPGERSEPHRHEGATLLTLSGSAKVRLGEGDWQVVLPGDVTVIGDEQMHEVEAGENGWRYLFACSKIEAQRQGLT